MLSADRAEDRPPAPPHGNVFAMPALETLFDAFFVRAGAHNRRGAGTVGGVGRERRGSRLGQGKHAAAAQDRRCHAAATDARLEREAGESGSSACVTKPRGGLPVEYSILATCVPLVV